MCIEGPSSPSWELPETFRPGWANRWTINQSGGCCDKEDEYYHVVAERLQEMDQSASTEMEVIARNSLIESAMTFYLTKEMLSRASILISELQKQTTYISHGYYLRSKVAATNLGR